ncbi:MAG TPA: septal ring lytic transglycosylase RlpA family protein [Candidatus Acidoferrales bacterium]|nr:septal ring lytic transglycosylase RlpA family protein [Candidatus Acidoferrales bacterium]
MRTYLRPTVFPKESTRASGRHRGFFPKLLPLAWVFSLLAAAGCSHRTYTVPPPVQPPTEQPSPPSGPPPTVERQPAVPGEYVEEGVASWYGVPFNGRRTSNGEIYDMHQFTAAHRTLPFGAIVRVTNLRNGMQTEVRVNDRGPFVANRVIDLSLSAAQAIGMVGAGTAPVRLEIVGGPNPQAGFFGVQVGAFQSQDNAERLRAQLAMLYAPISIATFESPNGLFYRVRVGRVPTESAARQLADQLQSAEQLTTFVVRLDD